jgi:hypothetical protein
MQTSILRRNPVRSPAPLEVEIRVFGLLDLRLLVLAPTLLVGIYDGSIWFEGFVAPWKVATILDPVLPVPTQLRVFGSIRFDYTIKSDITWASELPYTTGYVPLVFKNLSIQNIRSSAYTFPSMSTEI